MPDKKITDLAELTSIVEVNDYWFEIVDMSEGLATNRNKRVSEETLKAYFSGMAGLQTEVSEIGDWDMNADIVKFVSYSFTPGSKKIRHIAVIIYPDADVSTTSAYFLNHADLSTGLMHGWVTGASDTGVTLQRRAGGFFDTVNFDSTGFNRGYVTFWYDPTGS